ncbi:unnamed protein product, partial [Ectocarpus sp. 12 AP-2014]
MEHAVAMQNRGLLRYPFTVEPPALSAHGPASPGAGVAGSRSLSPPPSCSSPAGVLQDASTDTATRSTEGQRQGFYHDGGAAAAGAGDCGIGDRRCDDDLLAAEAAAELDDELDLRGLRESAESGNGSGAAGNGAGSAEAAMGAAVAAVERKPASLSCPRLEEWPGFPCPSKAFARAAPMESPKGGLPPSPQVLRFIHQVASAKAEGTPALYGLLDESALIAVGVLVEEMLEELVSPIVDGRTTGYKRATPASVARELEILGRMENRNSMAPAGDLPGHRHGALGGDSGCSGFGVGAVGSSDARKHAAMRHIFGETLDDMR